MRKRVGFYRILLPLAMILYMRPAGQAQSDTSVSPLKISGYLETYYVYDFSNPASHNRPDFLYSFHRHNEVNLNFGMIQAAYDNDRVRGTLALMAGTYANANLASEPGVLRNIFEANAGLKLSKTRALWVDAGIFSSHIGFESAVGATCWNMTRSIMAENSPYYLSGVKLSYSSGDGKWLLSGLVLNGWQRIQRRPGNQTPAFGHQLTWKPGRKVLLNSSSFIGNDQPDSLRRMRYFHNLYAKLTLHRTFGLIAGLDAGIEQRAKASRAYHTWYSPVLIARYTPSEKLAIAARAEYYSDANGVIIMTSTPNGFQTFGYSLNVDVRVSGQVLWRIEGRAFQSRKDNIFRDQNGDPSRLNYFAGTSLSIAF